MIPKVGQRWQFKNNTYFYVVEIVQTMPMFLVLVLTSNRGTHLVGEYFVPGHLTVAGYDSDWSYLEGQDKP